MAILREHYPHHDIMKRYIKSPFLMLGNQDNNEHYDFDVKYTTLDLDGGELKWDLNSDFPIDTFEKYNTVYNLGTLEHVWNIHQAFINTLRMITVGGYYLGHHPVSGYENHGVHITDWKMIHRFLEKNGFNVEKYWFSKQDGTDAIAPKRGDGNTILWIVARKRYNVTDFKCPQQVFKEGIAT